MSRVPKKLSERSSAHAGKRLGEIKEAAARRFFLTGYEGTDLRAIAGDLNMHAGSLYNYIQSKEEILYLLMKEALDDGIERVGAAAESTQGAAARLEAALEVYVKRHVLHREITFISEVEIRALTGRYRDEVFELRKRYEALWIRLVQEGVDSGELRDVDVRVVVYAILSLPWSLPLWFRENGRMTLDEVVQQYLQLVLSGIAVPSALGAAVAAPTRVLQVYGDSS